MVYFLGIGNVLYGVDADIKGSTVNNREEHIRRLAEVSHLLLDAGMILIVTAVELAEADLDLIKTIVQPDRIQTIWLGEKPATNISCDLWISKAVPLSDVVETIRSSLVVWGILAPALS